MNPFDDFDIGMLEELLEPCAFLVKSDAEPTDGQPGYDETYTPGAPFYAIFIKNSSTEAQVAQQQRLKEMYTVAVHWNTEVRHGDVFRRDKTGETLIATSATKDGAAPPSSSVPIAKFTAVPYDLPGEVSAT